VRGVASAGILGDDHPSDTLTTAVAPPFALLHSCRDPLSNQSEAEVRLVSGNAVSHTNDPPRKIAVWRNRASQLLLISEHDVRV